MLPRGISVKQFNGGSEAMARIAELHLQVRRWQIEQGTAKFLNHLYDSQADLRNIESYYIEPGGNFWIARKTDDNEIVGFVGLQRENEKEARLKRLAVLPDHQRQGIGSSLVDAVVSWAREADLRRINLATGRQELARPLYEKFGFAVIGVDESNNDYLMRLEIDR